MYGGKVWGEGGIPNKGKTRIKKVGDLTPPFIEKQSEWGGA